MAGLKMSAVEARESFIDNMDNLDFTKLVFLDEAGVNIGMSRAYGWALAGQTPVIERPARGRRYSLIGAIAADGCRAIREVQGYVNGEEFVTFLLEDLGPKLNDGDIVIMDGPSIHKVQGVEEALAKYGASALYLPPYSPELNPIEMTWAWLKRLLRTNPARKMAVLKKRVQQYWSEIPTKFCQKWIKHCGYGAST